VSRLRISREYTAGLIIDYEGRSPVNCIFNQCIDASNLPVRSYWPWRRQPIHPLASGTIWLFTTHIARAPWKRRRSLPSKRKELSEADTRVEEVARTLLPIELSTLNSPHALTKSVRAQLRKQGRTAKVLISAAPVQALAVSVFPRNFAELFGIGLIVFDQLFCATTPIFVTQKGWQALVPPLQFYG
jgi:hypothetical protein